LNLGLSKEDIEKFLGLFWKDQQSGINYKEFLRIFNRYKSKFEIEDENSGRGNEPMNTGESEAMVKLRKRVFDAIKAQLTKRDMDIRDIFNKIDSNKDEKISRIELKRMLHAMNVKLSEDEFEQLFKSIDIDGSQFITFPELHSVFTFTTENTVEVLIRDLKDKKRTEMASSKRGKKTTKVNLDGVIDSQGLGEYQPPSAEL
jgi:Ca2+-binding EF-hand superfamily protein